MGNRNSHGHVPCGKVCYPNRAAVRKALGRYQAHWYVYRCPACAAFHVTGNRDGKKQRHGRVHTTLVRTETDDELITCRPSVMDLRAMRNSIRLCEVRRVTPHLVLTQIESQGTLQAEARASLKQLGVDVLPGGLGRRAAFHHSIIDGLAAVEYEPKGKAALEVRALYKKICQLCGLAS